MEETRSLFDLKNFACGGIHAQIHIFIDTKTYSKNRYISTNIKINIFKKENRKKMKKIKIIKRGGGRLFDT